jgi:hypothetical protein
MAADARCVDSRTRGASVMEKKHTDFCELTNAELDYVVGGNASTCNCQRDLVKKAEALHAAQAKFEQ